MSIEINKHFTFFRKFHEIIFTIKVFKVCVYGIIKLANIYRSDGIPYPCYLSTILEFLLQKRNALIVNQSQSQYGYKLPPQTPPHKLLELITNIGH